LVSSCSATATRRTTTGTFCFTSNGAVCGLSLRSLAISNRATPRRFSWPGTLTQSTLPRNVNTFTLHGMWAERNDNTW
jgi:hypothetical protein